MRLLLWSDLQLHVWKTFGLSKDSVVSRRLQDQISVLNQIEQLIYDNGIELVIFGGDLFQKRGEIPVECINIIREWTQRVEKVCKIILVRGNHDLVSDTQYHEWRDALNFMEKDHGRVIRYDRLNICTVNYHESIDYDKIKNFDLVVLHKQPAMRDERGHAFSGVDWATLSDNNRLVVYGHYHKRIRLSSNSFTIGSPMALTFDDTDDRGIYIVDTEGVASTLKYEFEVINDLAVAFVKLQYPKFITVDEPTQVLDDGNYYRVLNATKRIDNENVLTVIKPKFFEERIKADDFNLILREWLEIHKKDETHIEMVKDLITDKVNSVKKFYTGKLTEISIHDFLSIGDIEFKIENGFVLITGINMDTDDSNGVGKSSIFEAINWCLTGETTKGLVGDDVIRRDTKNAKVTLRLTGDESYEISRSRREGIKIIKDGVNLVDGLRLVDAQITLDNILGFDKEVFRATCYFSQENLVMLTGLSDVNKTTMLTNLLGFATYDDLYEKVFDKIKSFEAEIEDRVKLKDGFNNQIINLKSKIDVINVNIRIDNEKITELKKGVEEFKTAEIKEPEYDYELEISKLVEKEKKLDQSIDDKFAEYDKVGGIAHGSRISLAKLEQQLEQKNAEISKLTGQINEMSSLGSSIGERCDKCGSLINADNVQTFIAEKNSQIAELEIGVTAIQSSILDLTNKSEDQTETLNKVMLERNALTSQRLVTKSAIAELRRNKESYDKYKTMMEKERARVENFNSQIKDFEKRIEKQLNERDGYNDEILGIDDKIIEIDWRIDKLRAGIEILEFWKMSFSPSGIRALLLDRFCNQFNGVVNSYLSTASNGTMSVALTPTKALKSGEERNKIGIDIYLQDAVVRYESLSGGEKRRVDVSLCLGLNAWISQRYGIASGLLGLLVLDEVFSFVDHSGEESIATMLYFEGMNKAVFVISHTADLGSYAERTMKLVKEKGITRLENEVKI